VQKVDPVEQPQTRLFLHSRDVLPISNSAVAHTRGVQRFHFLHHRNLHIFEMSRVLFSRTLPTAQVSTIGKRWAFSLGIWGVGAGTAALYLLSVTPIVKNGLLVKIPILGSYYEDKTPASDKPF